MDFAIYKRESGEISAIYKGPNFLLDLNTPDGFSAVSIDEGDDSTYRVDITSTPHRVVAKTEINYSINKTAIIANSVDVAVISGIPSGAQALFENGLHDIPAGVIEIDADIAGEYEIILKHPLYLDTTVTVIAE